MVNPFNQCKDLHLKPWQCPPLLFILMGLITIMAMLATYFIASRYESPVILVSSVSLVTIIIMTIGYFVVQGVSQIVELNQMKTEFVAIASHQLRTPLTSLGWTTGALEKTDMNSKQKELLLAIKESHQRMVELVNNLLNVSRIEQGKIKLIKEKFSVNKLIKETIKEFSSLAKARNVKIKLIETIDELPLRADKEKIRIIISNIINNAILYSKAQGKIKISLKKNLISIKDNGVGIPKEQQKLIFEKFFRSDNILKRQTQGTGLGLYIAKALVESHKGKIWFKSKENQGTTFYIKLKN